MLTIKIFIIVTHLKIKKKSIMPHVNPKINSFKPFRALAHVLRLCIKLFYVACDDNIAMHDTSLLKTKKTKFEFLATFF